MKSFDSSAFLAVLCLSIPSAAAAPQTLTVLDGSAMVPAPEPAHPQVAFDTSNRAHIVWAHLTDEGGASRYNIFYKLLAADGSTLIDATQISSVSDNASKSRKPQIAVHGTDVVYVAWHQSNNGIRLIGLNPSLDDRDGSASTLATIQRFAEIADFQGGDTGGGTSNHVYIDSDSSGQVHVLVTEQGAGMFCAVYGQTGAVVKALAQVGSKGSNNGTSSVQVALDGNNKMHIAHLTSGTNGYEAAYSMVDCAAGSTLIDATMLSTDDTIPSMQTSLAVVDNKVYVSWIDDADSNNNCTSGDPCHSMANHSASQTLRFVGLDPSLDDQSGDSAVLSTIRMSATTVATAQPLIWYPTMGATEAGNVQILYYTSNQPHTLYGVDLTTSGAVAQAERLIVDNNATVRASSNSKAFVRDRATAWVDGNNVKLLLRDVFVPNPDPPPVDDTPPTKGKGGGCSAAGTQAAALLLACLLLAVGRRRKRST